MKKGLLFATALCMATSAMAQTSIETALDAQTGKNNYQVDGQESQTIYWKFTADKDYLAKVSPLEGKYDIPNVIIVNGDGNQVTLGGASAGYPKQVYAMKKGQTYYFVYTSLGELGFNLDLKEYANYGKGMTEDNPIEIKLGEDLFIGNPEDKSATSCYATYKAEKTGKLKFNLNGYIGGATVNGVNYSAEYDTQTGGYVLGFPVEEGKTYSIKFSFYNAVLGNAEIAKVEPGTLDTPFVLADGENTVPAEQGDYYFTYQPTKAGYLNIQSEAILPGGQVKVYASKYDITQGNVAASSEAGSYNIHMQVPYTGPTYYIVVNKLQATQSEDKLNVSMDEFKAGETVNNPIEISALPSEQTLPEAKGTYYYSLNVPANTNKFVVIKANKTDLNESTSAIFYNRSNGEYNAATMQNGEIKQYFSENYDQTYILKVTSNEEEPLKLNIAYEEAAKGSLITNPAEAMAGDNNISIDGTEYFSYTATKTGKLTVEVEPGVTVSFPKGTNSYDGEYDCINKGVEYSISAQAGTTYLIKVTNAQKGTSIYLEESEFKAGEDRSLPIVMNGNTYTLTQNANNLWLEYEAKEDGVLDFACDVPYNGGSERIEVFKNEEQYGNTMMGNETVGSETNTVYKGKVTVQKGDKLYIHCMINSYKNANGENGSITFTQHAAEPGETVSTALVLERGKSINVSGASRNTPIWAKVSLPAGTSTFRYSNFLGTELYNSLEDAVNGVNSEEIRPNYVQLPDGSYVQEFTKTMTEAGEIYMKFTAQYDATVTLTYLDDTATGISSVEVFNDGKTEIFKADGTKVNKITGSGLYIIKAGGKTKKIMIKK